MWPARLDLNNAGWRKSTYSNGQGGDCLELADNIPGTVPVRDSKNPAGPVLFVTPAAWAVFVDGIRTGAR
ncbi:DUF397 domain-containing protein [Streptomyces sp. H-KF8]|uniref:DUF397 domain-containing protein n=1 Tax=Streptomyces sp. H-KF8 TaxID=1727216 RepID=UPI0007EDAD03|nr:DUF397 domain-containing protein [Streptomyces sp. H-KF8]OBQ47895.1 DUF397 domain-containing protein [Streptomyces sp. H-KF8]